MEKASVIKLQEAGYVFIRPQDYEGKSGKKKYAIKQSGEFGVWKILEFFDTKAARERAIKQLVELNNILY